MRPIVAGLGKYTPGKEYTCNAEYGIQEGDFVKMRLTGAKNDEEALEAFTDFLKRNNPVEFPKMNITVQEVQPEVKEAV